MIIDITGKCYGDEFDKRELCDFAREINFYCLIKKEFDQVCLNTWS